MSGVCIVQLIILCARVTLMHTLACILMASVRFLKGLT